MQMSYAVIRAVRMRSKRSLEAYVHKFGFVDGNFWVV